MVNGYEGELRYRGLYVPKDIEAVMSQEWVDVIKLRLKPLERTILGTD